MINLSHLWLGDAWLADLSFLGRLTKLTTLDFYNCPLASFSPPPGSLTNLAWLNLRNCQLTNFPVPAGANKLRYLLLSGNPLSTFEIPLWLSNNRLTNFAVAPGLTHLYEIFLQNNQLTSLVLPPGLTNMDNLDINHNPLKTLVVAEDATRLTNYLSCLSLYANDIDYHTYPVIPRMAVSLNSSANSIAMNLSGPPGSYTVIESADLVHWSPLMPLTNNVGIVTFSDPLATPTPQNRFYRVRSP